MLFVGRLVAKKGLDTALAATAATDGAFRLVVAGPGPLQPQGIRGVDVLGPIPSERVAELYRAADALLLPSRGEGFPVAVQEAMSSGLPVVMTNDPSYRRYLDGAGAGVRFVPTAPKVIAAPPGARFRPRGVGGGGPGGAAARAPRVRVGGGRRPARAAACSSRCRVTGFGVSGPGAQATTASERGAIP